MAEQQGTQNKIPDPHELAKSWTDIMERSQRLLSDFAARHAESPGLGMGDPFNVTEAFLEMTSKMMANPAKLFEAQAELWRSYVTLWQNATLRMMGESPDPVVTPEKGDRRFRDDAWQQNEVFDFLKQSYLLTANWIQSTVREVEGLEPQTARKVEFYTRQFVDAVSPSNFVMTNPEVLRATMESGGENLVKGLNNLLTDLERGRGRLRISMTDEKAFEVGANVAISPGKVVYQNDLMQLIQYDPATDKVKKRPLIIIPPWINKFYILDLRPKNSFVKWAVEQGHTVFMISWNNPDEAHREKNFADYMKLGPLAAMDAVTKATGEESFNFIGYCLGGTLLATTLAYMAAKGDERVASATYFVTLVDFQDAGELKVFIDEKQLKALESRMQELGYLDGADMATTFNMLRANDLLWSFVINNYLLGKEPFPFDLLYWNSDSTRMPEAMHSFYLRKCYLENVLREPGAVKLNGVEIDLSKIKVPTYMISTIEDHIAPWKGTYAGTQLYSGPVRFVLSGSGHIAGVVNHPDAQKYQYWTNTKLAADPDVWLKNAKEHAGSWWPDWEQWVAKFADGEVPARKPGDGKLKPIEDAPGSYVRVR